MAENDVDRNDIASKASGVPAVCKICRAPSASTIYGIPACRICKGIFKRGIQKKFSCQFDNSCNVRSNVENRCKACVFAKCARKGMTAQNIPSAPVVKQKKEKPPKVPKKTKKDDVPVESLPKPAAAPVDRYYEVKDDLKSLFEPSATKPFRFFDDEDDANADEFQTPRTLTNSGKSKSARDFEDETDFLQDQVLPATISVARPPGQTFFFTPNDPRLAEGMRWMSLDDSEREASLAEWKKNRPQIFADFKKLKKDANRKRKTYDRR